MLGDPAVAGEVWVVLHGYGQQAARFIRRFAKLPGVDSSARAVVAPEALSRFYVERESGPHGPSSRVGATWMTREDRQHEIRDYVEYLDRLAETVLAAGGDAGEEPAGEPGEEPGVARSAAEIDGGGRRLVVLGFSQGAETASRWATYGRIRPAELVLWAGGLAEDLEPGQAVEALRRARPLFVTGDADAWGRKRSEESLARLGEWGVEAERVAFAGGHVVDGEVLAGRWPAPGSPSP